MSGYRLGGYDDEEDIADEEFLRRAPGSGSLEEQRQKILQKKRELEQMTISSTERSLSSLRNTEEVGAATAQELYRQREQLERTEKRLDDINTTLRFSQKHIEGIKSVFGGLKNLISGKTKNSGPTTSAAKSIDCGSSTSTNQYEVVDRNSVTKKVEDPSLHPALKIRGLYDQDESAPSDIKAQDIIDKNLDQMLSSIHRLKGLSYTLGGEIDSQNELIDKVMDKTEIADISIHKQNKDIQKILK